jgi:cell division protein FtsW (lipid II flippase)
MGSAFAMYLVAGASWKDVAKLFLLGVLGIIILALLRPYFLERLKTFVNPDSISVQI